MKKNTRRIISTVAALVIVLGGIGAYQTFFQNKVASIVSLDVNPSIELHVDEDADIIEAVALNKDAEKVLAGMKLKGTDADTAVNAIIGSLLKHGYIDELANSILVSVEDKDRVRGTKLQEELTEEINEILNATAVNAAILAQQVDGDEVAEMADELDISKGKAELVQNILEVNDSYKANELAKLSVNELNLILSNPKNEVKNVVSTGKANDDKYIGYDAAKKAAYAHANVKSANVREVEVDFDYEYGTMVYEVDFASGEYEYEYTIDANDGTVLHSHREVDDDYVPEKESTKESENADETTTNNNTSSKDIGKAKAKSIALSHAGLKESKVTKLSVERDVDDGRIEYSVEFRANGKEYDYEINGANGKIIDYDIEVDEDYEEETASAVESTDIGKAKAKAAALKHAGLNESEVTGLSVERDVDDGRIEYSVEFRANGKEYDYEINGENGKILDYDIDIDEEDEDDD